MPFGELGAFFLSFRDPILAPREHLREPGSTLDGHFGVSDAPWEVIFALRDHPGGPYGLPPSYFLIHFWIDISTFGTSKTSSRMKFCTNRFFVAIVFNDFQDRFLLFFGGLENSFSGFGWCFYPWKPFWRCLVLSTILSSLSGRFFFIQVVSISASNYFLVLLKKH